jgi:O-antigen/teichoic acid export membrane protein
MVFAALVGGLIVVAPQLIVLLFTANYSASASLFMVWTLSMLFSALMTDSVLRVFARTRFLIFQNVLRLLVVALSITWFLGRFGLIGAVLVTLLAQLTAKVAGLWRIRGLLQCGLAKVLPWSGLALTAGITAVAMLPAVLLKPVLGLPLLPTLLVSGAVYLFAFAGLMWFCGPLTQSERRVAWQWLQLPMAWVSGNRRA